MTAKFRYNASRMLTPKNTEQAIERIMELDRVRDVAELVSSLTV